MAADQSKIRNFCIIAHIDHGKSTLADRIIEMTGLLTSREMQEQVLDNMELERERGITIKSQAVRTIYRADDGEEYTFNLIDTPGHVDFNYEVSRSLAACDGAILVVDAAQGIEAQTLANVYLALDHDLDVMPVINKIDLPSAEPDRVVHEIEDVIGIEAEDAPRISAKTGLNVHDVLEQVVKKIPAPTGDPAAPLKALIFDSVYDSYKGVIIFMRIKDGSVRKGTRIRMMATGAEADVVEVGFFGAGQFIPCEELSAGMVGYLTASLKNVRETRVGDTVTEVARPCAEALPGYKKVNPMVYCGLYPADGAKYPDLRDALEKLQLNDAALQFEPETSIALGFGFLNRCSLLIFPAVLLGRHRVHVGGVKRHQTRADRYVELGILFQLIGEHRRQAKARREHDDTEEQKDAHGPQRYERSVHFRRDLAHGEHGETLKVHAPQTLDQQDEEPRRRPEQAQRADEHQQGCDAEVLAEVDQSVDVELGVRLCQDEARQHEHNQTDEGVAHGHAFIAGVGRKQCGKLAA